MFGRWLINVVEFDLIIELAGIGSLLWWLYVINTYALLILWTEIPCVTIETLL